MSQRQIKPLRRHIQMIFQDPYASLNPRLKVVDAITEPLVIHGTTASEERRAIAAELVRSVSLPLDSLDRYPHQFSGGQRQRLCIARTLSSRPRLIIADEPVSALDVSVQADVLDLLCELQRESGLAYLFISHDIAVIEKISHRIAVLERGRIVETGPTKHVLRNPQHPYTRKLLSAVPIPDPLRKRPPVQVAEQPVSPVYPADTQPSELAYRSLNDGHSVLITG